LIGDDGPAACRSEEVSDLYGLAPVDPGVTVVRGTRQRVQNLWRTRRVRRRCRVAGSPQAPSAAGLSSCLRRCLPLPLSTLAKPGQTLMDNRG
jgi:hypothetical protein